MFLPKGILRKTPKKFTCPLTMVNAKTRRVWLGKNPFLQKADPNFCSPPFSRGELWKTAAAKIHSFRKVRFPWGIKARSSIFVGRLAIFFREKIRIFREKKSRKIGDRPERKVQWYDPELWKTRFYQLDFPKFWIFFPQKAGGLWKTVAANSIQRKSAFSF